MLSRIPCRLSYALHRATPAVRHTVPLPDAVSGLRPMPEYHKALLSHRQNIRAEASPPDILPIRADHTPSPPSSWNSAKIPQGIWMTEVFLPSIDFPTGFPAGYIHKSAHINAFCLPDSVVSERAALSYHTAVIRLIFWQRFFL